MTSKQPVQSPSSSATAVIPNPPTIKDSPAVERALNRSKLYLLVSWSLLYPEYTVVVPPPPVSIPLTYLMARDEQELADYVNALIDLKKRDGTLKKLYDYWVLGQFAENRQPRWSVIRNVLHWVNE